MTKGWYGQRQQHAMASKGVRSGKIRQYRAKGDVIENPITDPYDLPDFDINKHYWGLEKTGDEFSLRLGNWTDAGWHWSGDEQDFAGYLIRMSSAGQDVDRDFINIMDSYGVPFETLKELIIESAKSGDGVYMITGDNVKWHFGQDGEREYEVLDYDIGENEGLTKKELEEFKEYYWMEMDASSTDYDTFKESQYYKDLVDEITDAVENADSWEDVLNNLSGAKEVGEEVSWEFSDSAVREDIYEKFNDWNESGRWDKEVESGLPDDETMGNLINNFGRVETMKKVLHNYWDVESLDEAKNLVLQYEKDAIPKGRRKVEKGQKRLKDYEAKGLKIPKTKADARQQAIDWQNSFSEQNLSWGELIEYQNHFEKYGKKYGLLREFRENGII